MNNRYQLTKPFLSDKVYESSSVLKSAKKCYQEVKKAKLPNIKTFTIKDIDSNKSFIFQIHHPYMQKGGEGEETKDVVNPVLVQDQQTAPVNVTQHIESTVSDKFLELQTEIKKLDVRIAALEQIINPPVVPQTNAYVKSIERLHSQNDQTCSIM
jgi:hypothetical protein